VEKIILDAGNNRHKYIFSICRNVFVYGKYEYDKTKDIHTSMFHVL
jgi:hypothetical protein